ncbi:MAG: 30S ribosomal protein S20 [Hyphomonadaceae bacterium]|nr:30S ribosomal protein S20 [Hyphomonadaceae bacterium]
MTLGRRMGISPGSFAAPRLWAEGDMANTKSAKKAIRVIERRTAVNKARRSRMRTTWRAVEEAIAAGDAKAAEAALRAAESETSRAAGKGVIHKNTSARKVSRLSKRVKALAKV